MSELTLLSAVTAAGAGSAVATGGAPGALLQVYSAAGSKAEVVLQGSFNGSAWDTVAKIGNPALAGEAWRGTAFPWMRAVVPTYASGTISAIGHSLDYDPGAWAAAIASQATSAPTYGFISTAITVAKIKAQATDATTTLKTNYFIGTLPANSRVIATYLDVTAAEASDGNAFTGSMGVTAAAYVDWIVACDCQAVARYGAAVGAGGRGATNIDGALFYTTAQPIYCQFIKTTTHLHDITAFAATAIVEYVTYP